MAIRDRLLGITKEAVEDVYEENRQVARQAWRFVEDAIAEAYQKKIKNIWVVTNVSRKVMAMLLNRIEQMRLNDKEFNRLGLYFRFFQRKNQNHEIKILWDAQQSKDDIIVKIIMV